MFEIDEWNIEVENNLKEQIADTNKLIKNTKQLIKKYPQDKCLQLMLEQDYFIKQQLEILLKNRGQNA